MMATMLRPGITSPPGAAQTQILVGSGTASVTFGFRLVLVGRKPAFQVATTVGLVTQVISPVEIPLGQWAHVAAVRLGSTVTLYVDGVARAQGQFPNGAIPAVPFMVGGNNMEPRHSLVGTLHNVGVYSTALAQSRVSEIGLHGMDAADPSLVLHLPLRDKTPTDLGPQKRPIVVTGPLSLAAGENLATRTIAWNGSSTYVTVDSSAFNFGASPFTISGFFRTAAPGAALQTLVSKGFAAGGDGYRLALVSGILTFNAKTGSKSLSVSAGTAPITNAAWHHFGVVRAPNGPDKKDSLNLYLDGKFQGRADVPSGMTFSANGKLALGATVGSPSSGYLNGELDSVAFFSRGMLGRELRMQTDFGPNPKDPSLLALYTFESDFLLDVSAGERHGALGGSTTRRPGIRFAGHDFMLDLWRRSNGKGLTPIPKQTTVALGTASSFAYGDIPNAIPLDPTPPTAVSHGPYPPIHDDGVPEGTEPYRLTRPDNFNFDYFTPGLSYGWIHAGPLNEYAALHGFSAVGVYNDANGQRTVPAATKFTVNLGFDHLSYLAARGADNWDDLAQTPESSLTLAWNETNSPSLYANYDWVVADVEGTLPRGPGSEDDFYAERPNPSRGAPEREGFRRSYRALAAAIKGNGKLVGNYGWSPAGPRDFWSSPHLYPENVFPSDLADWETHSASITEMMDLITPSAYVVHPGSTPFIVMMNAVQARNVMNLRADLEEKKLLPYLWNLFHGNGDPRLWQAWNPLTREEMAAAVFELLLTGVDGFILWDAEPSNPNLASALPGVFRRAQESFVTGAPIVAGVAGSACGRAYPQPTSARQVKAYDPIYVVNVSDDLVDYQVGVRDPNGFALGSCSPDSDCPGCDQMSSAERAEFLTRRFLREAPQVDLVPLPTTPTFPVYRMTKAEFEQRMMARATNLRAMFQSMALARWIERALHFGVPMDSLKAGADADRRAALQRGVGFISVAESQYGPYMFVAPFDAAWQNSSLPPANIRITNFGGTGSNVTVAADKEARYYVLFPEP